MKKKYQFKLQAGLFKSLFFLSLFIGTVVTSIFSPQEGMAQGNLLILPRRVVFEGSKKSQELTLANTGADTAKYVVSFVQLRMKEDGAVELITTPDSGQYFSDQYFRFYPRAVTLAPGTSQVVKMQLTKNSKMEPGEYRSHLYFRSVPKDTPLGQDPALKDSSAVTVKLTPIFGITIPAIIRVGECSAKVTLGDLSVNMANDTLTTVKMKFTRSGNISVYGDIAVDYISPAGKTTRVANAKGVAVYTPNTIRTFQCNLDKKEGIDYHKGKLHVTFSAPEDVKASKLAEAELVLR
jgi:P pilus assembly chaperone PapD